jgi:hypothetical protein
MRLRAMTQLLLGRLTRPSLGTFYRCAPRTARQLQSPRGRFAAARPQDLAGDSRRISKNDVLFAMNEIEATHDGKIGAAEFRRWYLRKTIGHAVRVLARLHVACLLLLSALSRRTRAPACVLLAPAPSPRASPRVPLASRRVASSTGCW